MGELKGLGDLVQRITSVTGIDRAVKAIVGEDCGCDERQELLNRLIPFKTSIPKDETESHAWALTFVIELQWRIKAQKTINRDEFQIMWDIYRKYINPRKKNTDCKSCMRNSIEEMRRVLEAPIKEAEKDPRPVTLPKYTGVEKVITFNATLETDSEPVAKRPNAAPNKRKSRAKKQTPKAKTK